MKTAYTMLKCTYGLIFSHLHGFIDSTHGILALGLTSIMSAFSPVIGPASKLWILDSIPVITKV